MHHMAARTRSINRTIFCIDFAYEFIQTFILPHAFSGMLRGKLRNGFALQNDPAPGKVSVEIVSDDAAIAGNQEAHASCALVCILPCAIYYIDSRLSSRSGYHAGIAVKGVPLPMAAFWHG